jgi:hypothetical protein
VEPIEVFQILGIEQTKDERALKNAYRDKLTVTNPEDDPEGFKRLRTAYEEACRYAGTPDAEENEEAEPTLEDDTPAGQWVRGVRKVYENITDRCDVEKWKALFEADDFLSLEEEENCTTYLLRFLMEHYKLPTAIWKLLDEKIHIVQNAGAFRERFPAQFVSYMVHKCESGEEVDFSEFRGAEDADYDQFLQYYDRAYQALQEKKLQEAEQMIGCGDALFKEGMAHATIAGPWLIPTVRESGMDVGIASMPVIDETGKPIAPYMGVQGVQVLKNAAENKKDAVEQVLRVLMKDEVGIALAQASGCAPARENCYSYEEVNGDEVVMAMKETAENAVPMPNLPEMDVMWTVASGLLTDVNMAGNDVAESAEKAQKEALQLIESMK